MPWFPELDHLIQPLVKTLLAAANTILQHMSYLGYGQQDKQYSLSIHSCHCIIGCECWPRKIYSTPFKKRIVIYYVCFWGLNACLSQIIIAFCMALSNKFIWNSRLISPFDVNVKHLLISNWKQKTRFSWNVWASFSFALTLYVDRHLWVNITQQVAYIYKPIHKWGYNALKDTIWCFLSTSSFLANFFLIFRCGIPMADTIKWGTNTRAAPLISAIEQKQSLSNLKRHPMGNPFFCIIWDISTCH